MEALGFYQWIRLNESVEKMKYVYDTTYPIQIILSSYLDKIKELFNSLPKSEEYLIELEQRGTSMLIVTFSQTEDDIFSTFGVGEKSELIFNTPDKYSLKFELGNNSMYKLFKESPRKSSILFSEGEGISPEDFEKSRTWTPSRVSIIAREEVAEQIIANVTKAIHEAIFIQIAKRPKSYGSAYKPSDYIPKKDAAELEKEIAASLLMKGKQKEDTIAEINAEVLRIISQDLAKLIMDSLLVSKEPLSLRSEEMSTKNAELVTLIQNNSTSEFLQNQELVTDSLTLMKSLLIESYSNRPNHVEMSYLLSDLVKALLEKYETPQDLGKAYLSAS